MNRTIGLVVAGLIGTLAVIGLIVAIVKDSMFLGTVTALVAVAALIVASGGNPERIGDRIIELAWPHRNQHTGGLDNNVDPLGPDQH